MIEKPLEPEASEPKKEKEKKKGSFFPSIFGKKEKSRDQILYEMLLDSQGELKRMMNYLDITTVEDRRRWVFMWTDMGKSN